MLVGGKVTRTPGGNVAGIIPVLGFPAGENAGTDPIVGLFYCYYDDDNDLQKAGQILKNIRKNGYISKNECLSTLQVHIIIE